MDGRSDPSGPLQGSCARDADDGGPLHQWVGEEPSHRLCAPAPGCSRCPATWAFWIFACASAPKANSCVSSLTVGRAAIRAVHRLAGAKLEPTGRARRRQIPGRGAGGSGAGRRLIDIRAILLDLVDLRGLPTVEHGKAAGPPRPSCPTRPPFATSWCSTGRSANTACPTGGPCSPPATAKAIAPSRRACRARWPTVSSTSASSPISTTGRAGQWARPICGRRSSPSCADAPTCCIASSRRTKPSPPPAPGPRSRTSSPPPRHPSRVRPLPGHRRPWCRHRVHRLPARVPLPALARRHPANPATAPVPDEPSAFGVIVFPGSATSQQEPRRQSQSARHPGVAVQRARVGVGQKGRPIIALPACAVSLPPMPLERPA